MASKVKSETHTDAGAKLIADVEKELDSIEARLADFSGRETQYQDVSDIENLKKNKKRKEDYLKGLQDMFELFNT